MPRQCRQWNGKGFKPSCLTKQYPPWCHCDKKTGGGAKKDGDAGGSGNGSPPGGRPGGGGGGRPGGGGGGVLRGNSGFNPLFPGGAGLAFRNVPVHSGLQEYARNLSSLIGPVMGPSVAAPAAIAASVTQSMKAPQAGPPKPKVGGGGSTQAIIGWRSFLRSCLGRGRTRRQCEIDYGELLKQTK